MNHFLRSRSFLANLIKALIVLIVLIFTYILLKGMFWSPIDKSKEVAEIKLGSTQFVKVKKQRLWVSRLSEQQKKDAKYLESLVHQDVGCDIAAETCLINPSTKMQGVIIRFVEPKVFDEDGKPKGIWPSFVNPLNNAEYDLLGRGFLSNPEDAPKSIQYIDQPK